MDFSEQPRSFLKNTCQKLVLTVAALAFCPAALYLSFVNQSTPPQLTQRVLLVAYYFPPLGMGGTQR